MKYNILIISALLLLSLVVSSCDNSSKVKQTPPTTKIAFGSCGHETDDLPVFDRIAEHEPDFFIFVGDNIYGDTYNMDTLRVKYQRLGSKASYQNLKSKTSILATWDDHDYGWNDSGKEYPFKTESKEIFMEFFEEPDSSSRRNHEGIYHSYLFDYKDKKLQIILLDVRTFRDRLKGYSGEFEHDGRYKFYNQDYVPHESPDSTLLGDKQWQWLESELRKSADLRLICSGTQFGIEWNGYEAWANFPYEQQRMLDLIKNTNANGVIFLTGDVHYSELSKLETDFYPIYDFTSSGLSSTWMFATPNRNRIEGPVMDNHFGLLTITWTDDPVIKMETWDVSNNQRFEYTIQKSDISFK